MRSRKKEQEETGEAALTIETDALVITTQEAGVFRLPKMVVDQLVSALLISGFGPQTPAQYNTILTFRDLKHQVAEEESGTGRHR